MIHNHVSVQFTSVNFDTGLDLARKHGIDAFQVQIKPPQEKDQAWCISEIRFHWPTQADSIAIHVSNHSVMISFILMIIL